MALPKHYQWLAKEPGPRMLIESLKLYGTTEVFGGKHNPTILKWGKELGISHLYQNDELAWCSLVHAVVAVKAGKEVLFQGWDLLRALSWVKWEQEVKQPMLGDTLVFKRSGGGHVGLYTCEDRFAYHVLGGNQGNQHNIMRIGKDRLLTARRPHYRVEPPNIRRIFITPTGQLSTNEA